MKIVKKAAAVLAACAIVIGMTACNTDPANAVVAENANTKITMGAYAYCMYQAYYSASYYVPDSTLPVLEQEIEGKSAVDWMKDTAVETMKSMFAVDAKAKEVGVALTDEERKNIDTNMNQAWNTGDSSTKKLMSYGITKEGAKQFYYEFNTKYTKIFQTMYAPDGVKGVSAEDKKAYFTENYTDFAYIGKDISSLSDEEKATAKETFEGYVASMNDGSKTIEEVAEEYKTAEGLSSDPLQTEATNLSTNTEYQQYYPEMVTELQNMETDKASLVETNSIYLLVQKHDINAIADEKLSDEDFDLQLLIDMKGNEYIEDMTKFAEEYTDFTLHEDVIARFDPAVFEEEGEEGSSSEASDLIDDKDGMESGEDALESGDENVDVGSGDVATSSAVVDESSAVVEDPVSEAVSSEESVTS